MANKQAVLVDEIEFTIPIDVLREFEAEEFRIVLRHPWVVGIPVPDALLHKPDLLRKFGKEYEVMLVPRQLQR